jgi:hypothetical protein
MTWSFPIPNRDSDKKADLHLITTGTGQRRSLVIDTLLRLID